MRISRNAIQMAVAGAIVGTGLGFASTANAGIEYDLRLTNGTYNQTVTAPGAYQLQLWAVITGTDTDHTNDTLTNSYIQIVSTQTNGGAMVGAGDGMADGTPFAPFNANAKNGGATDVNGDGVLDWGSTSNNLTNTNYMFVRASAAVPAGGSVGDAVSAQAWEYEIATFNVDITQLGSGSTSFLVVKPPATKNGTFAATGYAVYTQDGVNETSSTLNADTYASDKAVTFTTGSVPEPASLSLLGLGALGLLGRRRKRSAE